MNKSDYYDNKVPNLLLEIDSNNLNDDGDVSINHRGNDNNLGNFTPTNFQGSDSIGSRRKIDLSINTSKKYSYDFS